MNFSRRNLELECPFRLQKWKDYDRYFDKIREENPEQQVLVGKVEPCSGVVYEGHLLNTGFSKIRHGFGRQIGDDNTVYYGTWQHGCKTGYAFIKYRNGNEYVGQVLDSTRNGYGTMKWVDGSTYTGMWWSDEKHG